MISRTAQRILTATVVAALSTALGWAVFSGAAGRGRLDEMTCSELTVEMLDMTGTSPTEPYDSDHARAINAERDRKGC